MDGLMSELNAFVNLLCTYTRVAGTRAESSLYAHIGIRSTATASTGHRGLTHPAGARKSFGTAEEHVVGQKGTLLVHSITY
jgi:hypothetical protein